MSSPKRVKRPTPARTQPIRNWSAIFGGGATRAGDGAAERPSGATMNDLVSQSVQLGYRVVDEYIRQGQRAAQRVSDRSYDPGAMAGELQQMAAQMGRFASDFAALWFELVRVAAPGVVGAQPGAAAAAPRPAPPAAPDAAAIAPAEAAEAVRTRVEVASVRPAEVTLDLSPAAASRELAVEALRAVDQKLPVLKGVAFASAPDGERTLRVRVPKEHPPGVYNGLILDAASGRPLGTVSIKIAAR